MGDNRAFEAYAQMLQELGFDVHPTDIGHVEEAPEKTRDTSHDPVMIPSFVHMEQLTQERAYIPYRRMTHFVQHLAQVTGRVHLDGLRPIITRLKRAGVKTIQPMAYFRIRRLLKKWGYSSTHYRAIFTILREMGGEVLRLSYAQEVALRSDFERLCVAFDASKEVHKRNNFLSYYLVIQLLLEKYKIPCFYRLPSIKDTLKFRSLVAVYYTMTH